jgi:hypothetical protein
VQLPQDTKPPQPSGQSPHCACRLEHVNGVQQYVIVPSSTHG